MKISELAQATAINAEDVFPVVQGGETKKVPAEVLLGKQPTGLTFTEDGKIQLMANEEKIGDGIELPDSKIETDSKLSSISENPIQNKVVSQTVANALRGSASGAIVSATDISPVEHQMNVKVRGKNLWNGGDITVTNKYANVNLVNTLLAGQAYTLSADVESNDTDATQCLVYDATNTAVLGFIDRGERVPLTFTPKKDCNLIQIYASKDYNASVDDTATLKNVQLEAGSSATKYVPYVALSEITVNRYGKNLLPYPYADTTKTVNGITFTDNGDGTITANGTATANADFRLVTGGVMPPSVYTISGTPAGGNRNIYFMEINCTGQSSLTDYGSSGTTDYSSVINNLVIAKAYIRIASGTTVNNLVFKPLVEQGDGATEYEKYIAPESYTPNDDGIVENMITDRATITLVPDTEGAVISCEYNKDTNKVIEHLVNAIISLGGNV